MNTVVIPTFWGWEHGSQCPPEDSVFDHPTPLDGHDTLSRCLHSLTAASSPFQVLIVTAAVNPTLNARAEARVSAIIARFRKYFPIMQFASSDLRLVKERLSYYGLDPCLFNLDTYPSIRNCQLMAPAVLGSEMIVAIDDDEVVMPDFMQKAVAHAGKVCYGKRVDGVAGLYYYSWGTYRVKEPDHAKTSTNLFDRKAVLQNQSYDGFMSAPGRLVDTTIILGGNMVFTRDVFRSVPFDPMIPRGEDIDYLINSKMYGFTWMLDKELTIQHFPPPTVPSRKLQEDFIRFVYEKKKIELSQSKKGLIPVYAEDLVPYPGEFLKEGIINEGLEALRLRNRDARQPFYKAPEQILEIAMQRAGRAEMFFDFAEKWPQVMERLSGDKKLKDHLQGKAYNSGK